MASVTLKNVTKKYGGVLAVDHLSMEVGDGDFMVMLGPSGCGKSTTLNCIAGLETIDSGEVYIGDRLVNDVEPKDRNIAMVFQNYALYPHMTVEDNIAFPLRMHKVPKDQAKLKIREAAEILQIMHLLGRKPREVSGGEAQRVALARAIVRQPAVFLMDEPLSNLDANLRLHMRLELRRLQRELKITTIYVTHDQAEAMTMADRVAIIKDGAVQQVDEPHTIYRKPSNAFVAGFVGNPPMNLLNGEVRGRPEDGGVTFVTSDLSFALPQSIARALAGSSTPRKVILGMRPEDLSVTRAETEISFDGSLLAVEPLGSYSLVDIKVGDTILKVQEGPYYVGNPGAKVVVHASKERLHLFDGADGKAIF
jgi:multiple sugar transport system ATP-binding protein